jgi:hypothetical protein
MRSKIAKQDNASRIEPVWLNPAGQVAVWQTWVGVPGDLCFWACLKTGQRKGGQSPAQDVTSTRNFGTAKSVRGVFLKQYLGLNKLSGQTLGLVQSCVTFRTNEDNDAVGSTFNPRRGS